MSEFSGAKIQSGDDDLPNFFLMTLSIFFWSNFLGRPWTVVKVLRPLRSVVTLQPRLPSALKEL